MANPISSPLSLHSLSMEAILKNEIPTTHLSMLPTTLLEDILFLKKCEGTYHLTSYSESYVSLPARAPLPLPEFNPFGPPVSKVVVARHGPGTWSWSLDGYIFSLGREIGSVCWVEGSTIKAHLEIKNQRTNQMELFILEYNFEATGLECNFIHRTEENEKIVKGKYVKM